MIRLRERNKGTFTTALTGNTKKSQGRARGVAPAGNFKRSGRGEFDAGTDREDERARATPPARNRPRFRYDSFAGTYPPSGRNSCGSLDAGNSPGLQALSDKEKSDLRELAKKEQKLLRK